MFIPRWAVIALGPVTFLVVVPLAHGGLPWALALLGHRYGWRNGAPGSANLHPMYVAEAALWLGWSLLFGSVIVLLGLVLVCLAARALASREEQALESEFGEEYREYKGRVPRWLALR